MDYLTGKTDFIADEAINNRIVTLQKLPEQDREHILFALDAMIRDTKGHYLLINEKNTHLKGGFLFLSLF